MGRNIKKGVKTEYMQGLKKINGKEVYIDSKRVKHGDEMLNEVLEDTGWITPTLNSGWSSQYSSAPVRYRKINNIVYLESFVTASANADTTMFTLPVGFRPTAQYKRLVCHHTAGYVMMNIGNDGKVSRLTGTNTAMTWICIATSFPVD